MATKKEQIEFVKQIYPAAKKMYDSDPNAAIHPLFVTAQAALETGWKIRGINNNIFGITIGSSWKGRMQLVETTEIFSTPDKKFAPPEEVLSVVPLKDGKWKYKVRRYFRVYNSLEECLKDHLALLKKPMYADAWVYRNEPIEYAKRLVDDTGAKYATDPDYASVMASMIKQVDKIVKDIGL